MSSDTSRIALCTGRFFSFPYMTSPNARPAKQTRMPVMSRERPVSPRNVTEARSGRTSSDSSARAVDAEKSARRRGAAGARRSQVAARRAGGGGVVMRVNVLSSGAKRGGSDRQRPRHDRGRRGSWKRRAPRISSSGSRRPGRVDPVHDDADVHLLVAAPAVADDVHELHRIVVFDGVLGREKDDLRAAIPQDFLEADRDVLRVDLLLVQVVLPVCRERHDDLVRRWRRVRRCRGRVRRDLHVVAALQKRLDDHEDDEKDENDVHERSHVDLRLGSVATSDVHGITPYLSGFFSVMRPTRSNPPSLIILMTFLTSPKFRVLSALMRMSLFAARSPISFIFASKSFGGNHFVSMKMVLSEITEMMSSLSDSGFLSGRSVCGSVTGLPFWSIGVTTMKMMRRTRHTSTSGVTLMSLFML